jgi:hypothetical protein
MPGAFGGAARSWAIARSVGLSGRNPFENPVAVAAGLATLKATRLRVLPASCRAHARTDDSPSVRRGTLAWILRAGDRRHVRHLLCTHRPGDLLSVMACDKDRFNRFFITCSTPACTCAVGVRGRLRVRAHVTILR